MYLYACTIVKGVSARLCMALVLRNQACGADQRAHAEDRSQNRGQCRHEYREDDAGHADDQQCPCLLYTSDAADD